MTNAEVSVHLSEEKWTPLGDRYPAEEALAEFRQRARPALIETIRSETTFTQRSENALELFMLIGAVHPDQAIKMLVDAAAETSGTGAEMLRVAASKALVTPECERVRPACENVAIPTENAAPAN
jgi:hypothetical protein